MLIYFAKGISMKLQMMLMVVILSQLTLAQSESQGYSLGNETYHTRWILRSDFGITWIKNTENQYLTEYYYNHDHTFINSPTFRIGFGLEDLLGEWFAFYPLNYNYYRNGSMIYSSSNDAVIQERALFHDVWSLNASIGMYAYLPFSTDMIKVGIECGVGWYEGVVTPLRQNSVSKNYLISSWTIPFAFVVQVRALPWLVIDIMPYQYDLNLKDGNALDDLWSESNGFSSNIGVYRSSIGFNIALSGTSAKPTIVTTTTQPPCPPAIVLSYRSIPPLQIDLTEDIRNALDIEIRKIEDRVSSFPGKYRIHVVGHTDPTEAWDSRTNNYSFVCDIDPNIYLLDPQTRETDKEMVECLGVLGNYNLGLWRAEKVAEYFRAKTKGFNVSASSSGIYYGPKQRNDELIEDYYKRLRYVEIFVMKIND
jgi:hypothetical protein